MSALSRVMSIVYPLRLLPPYESFDDADFRSCRQVLEPYAEWLH